MKIIKNKTHDDDDDDDDDEADCMECVGDYANILNKQSRTDNKGWPSSFGVGHGVNNPSP
jgi:hypothetical protein